MRNKLLQTTAIVTAGFVAATPAQAEGGIKIGLGGFMNNWFAAGPVDDDENDFAPTGLFSQGEVHFLGETTLDNGLTFGAQIELEAVTESDQIDENFGYVQGGFGKLQFGSENVASYLMQFAAPKVGAIINTGWITSFIPVPEGWSGEKRTPGLSTFLDPGNDENLLTYFTPRMYGFQLGLSYVPAVVNTGDGKNFPVQADNDTEYKHALSVGLNFVESFGGVDVGIAAGYSHTSAPDDDITVIDPSGGVNTNGAAQKVRRFSLRDRQQVSAGVKLGYAGFGLTGSVAGEIDGRMKATSSSFTNTDFGGATLGASRTPQGVFQSRITTITPTTYTSGVESTEGVSWEAGLHYTTGPWIFQGVWFHGESEGDVLIGDEDKLDAVQLVAEYSLGPGINVSLTGLYGRYDGENGLDNQGLVGIAGVDFRF